MKTNCRSDKTDPIYNSTNNWKTENQWLKLGYRVPFLVLHAERLSYYDGVFKLYGFKNSYCQSRAVRYHRSIVRKIRNGKFDNKD